MNVNALAINQLKYLIERSTHEFREYFDIFFDGMQQTLGPKPQRPRYLSRDLVLRCDIRDYLCQATTDKALQGAYQNVRDALKAKLVATFQNYFASHEFSQLSENPNISNSRFIGFIDQLMSESPFSPDGDEEDSSPRFSYALTKLVERIYAAAAYRGMEGAGLNASTPSMSTVSGGWISMFNDLLDGLTQLRASLKAGAGVSVGVRAQSSRTVASTVYQMTLEEVELVDGQPLQTFSQAFQMALYDYSSQEQKVFILNNGRVALKATIVNNGTDEQIYYMNGGPITYWRLGSLITI